MTRKHFIALAKALYENQPYENETGEYSTWLAVCNSIATACHDNNSSFKHVKFIDACMHGADLL